MPQAGGAINVPKPKKPKPAPRPVTPQQAPRETYTTKAAAAAKAKIKNVSTADYGEPVPHKANPAKNAGVGSNPNLDTTAKSGPRKVAGGGTSGADYERPEKKSPAKKTTSRTGARETTSTQPVFKRGGSTFSRPDGVTSRDSGGGGGGFPEFHGPESFQGAPAYFDANGGGGGGGGETGGATNPLASSVSSAFSNASMEEVLHGNKKKGRAKRSRRTE